MVLKTFGDNNMISSKMNGTIYTKNYIDVCTHMGTNSIAGLHANVPYYLGPN